METTGINKTVYRNDVISALDSFTSVRNVLAWEMFQDGQVRNYDGVLNDLQRLYPDIDFDSVTENVDPEGIAADEDAIYALVDNIINKLIESGISKDNFNYAIWACDDPENVADTYGVDIGDVSAYKITDGILLQDLGYEGQLYGVAEYPEEEWDVIESALKGGNMKTIEQYKDYYLKKLIRDYGEFTSRDYNSAKDFCYNEEWKLSEQQERLMRKQFRAATPEEEKIIDEKMADKGNAIEGLDAALIEYQKQYKEGFEIMNNKNINSANNIPDDPTKVPPVPPTRPIPNKPPKREDDTPPSPKRIRDKYGKSFKDYLDEELEKNNASNSLKRTIKSSKEEELEMFNEESKYGNRREFEDFKRNHPESTITYLDWRKYLNGYEDDVEYEYEDENGNMYTWDMIKTEIDNWVDSGDFEEQNGELPEYFEKDGTPKYKKIYDDFWDIGSNGVMEYIGSSLEPEWTVYEPHFKNLKPRHEDDPKNGWGMMADEKDSLIEENGGKVTVEYGHGGSCTLYGAETGDVISTFTTIKEMQDFKRNHNLTIVKNSRRNNMKKTIKSAVRDHYLLGKQNFLTEHIFGIDDDGDVEYEYDFGEELVDAEMSIFENSDTGFVGFDIESHQAGKTKTRHEVLDYDGLENKIEGSDIKNGVAIYEDSNGIITVATMGSNWHNSKTGEEGTDYTLFKAVDYNAEPEDEEIESSRKPIKSSKWVEDVADKKGITFEQVLEVFKDNGYGEDEADNFWNSKWNDVSDAFGEDGIAGLDELFGMEITSAHKSIKSSSMIYKENEMPSVMKDRIYWEIYYYNEGDNKELGTQNRYDSVRGMSFTQAKRRAKQLMKDYNCDTACIQTTGGNGVIIKNDSIGDKNMKIQSKRLIKSGPGAGYDITVRGIELDNHNWKILKDDYEERYGSHTVQVEIPVKPCVAEYWAAEAYYDGIDSKHDMYDGNWDSQIDGGTAILQMEVYPEYTDDVLSQEELDEAIGNLLPSELDLTMVYGGGWSHVNLPEEGIAFDDDNGRINLDEGETYDYTTIRCELKCPNITQNINAFFKNPDAYYDEDGMPQYPGDDIE